MADITTGPTVARTPSAVVVEDPSGTPTKHDISCAVQFWDHTADTEELDASTFCSPGATEIGITTHSLVVGMLWSEELEQSLSPLVGQTVYFEFKDNAADTNVTRFESRFGSVPYGRHEVGQLIPVELACAVLTAPVTTTPTP